MAGGAGGIMILAWLRYLACAPLDLAAKAVTYLLAPIVAIPDRNTLPRGLRWMQTFDADLDNYWTHGGYADWLRVRFDQHYYDTHAWLRWACRVLWLWRNPAYGFALALGFDQNGLEYLRDDDPVDRRWDGSGNVSLWRTFRNRRGSVGFLYRARIFYTSTRYLEIVAGWKVPWEDERLAMLAVRCTPFRSI